MPKQKRPRRASSNMSPDIDGDSTMHSSADEDEMFPDEALPNNPATPLHTSVSNMAASELSPPNSQGPATTRDSSTLSSTVNANGKRPLSLAQAATTTAAGQGTHTDAETGYTWSKQEDQPGWEWKSTRAREEEIRALEVIVDQGSQIKSM